MINTEPKLTEARHQKGWYSINEIRQMFPRANGKPMGRSRLDIAMNSGKLPYISPNNRDRFIHIDHIEKFMLGTGNDSGNNNSTIVVLPGQKMRRQA